MRTARPVQGVSPDVRSVGVRFGRPHLVGDDGLGTLLFQVRTFL